MNEADGAGEQAEIEQLRREVAGLRAQLATLEQRRATDENELALLVSLLRGLPAFVIRVDSQLRMTFMNKFEPGYGLEDVIGRDVYTYIDPDWVPAARDCIEHVRRTGEIAGYRVIGKSRQGPPRHYETTVAPIRDSDGSMGLCLIALDVSEQVRREQALRDNDLKLRMAVEASGMGLWSWDPTTDEVEWNDRMFQITGADIPLPITAYVERCVHPDDRDRARRTIREILDGARTQWDVHRILRAQGDVRWVVPTCTVFRNAQGGAQKVVGGLVDLTHQRRLEEQLRQAQKMEAVGTLTAGIAHNFNNMLGAILPSLEILQRSANDRDAMLISDALHAGYRAADMVRHLMTFSGQRRARTEIPCDPAIVVRQALAMCRGTIESHVTLEERVEPSLPAVLCDEGALEQVLVNLVLNARDAVLEARRAAPRIEISASLAMRARGGNSSLARTRFVCFRVSDNGTGIADAVRSRLFEPFVTTKVPGKGTGLGLAVSYAIAKDHHGFIEVESRPYLGATFSLYLPTCDAAAQSTESVYPAEDAARPARLLVVDDDDAVRSIVERLLRSAGHAVWTASGARHALVVLAETAPIDLVFLDRAMPDRPGSAIVDDIRRLAPRAKIVYLTGQDVPVHERRVVEDVLYKPVTRAALLEVVARLVT